MTLLPTDKSHAPTLASGHAGVPALIADLGEAAVWSFLEFFTARIENDHTRAAYVRVVGRFLRWVEEHGLTLPEIRPPHVAAYLKELGRSVSVPSVKQALAAIRSLFDHLVVSQVVPLNPAACVRGPSHVVTSGKTPVLDEVEARQLLDSIDTASVVGLRDRALIGVMVYTFARVGAAVGLRVEDYFPQGKRWFLTLHEKRGRVHRMPCHHKLEEMLDRYIEAAGIEGDQKGPMFRSAAGRSLQLTANAMSTRDAWAMVRRRAENVGLATRIGCHTFRATGITAYLSNGGTLEKAQRWPGTPRRKRPSCTTGEAIRSHSTRWNASPSDPFRLFSRVPSPDHRRGQRRIFSAFATLASAGRWERVAVSRPSPVSRTCAVASAAGHRRFPAPLPAVS